MKPPIAFDFESEMILPRPDYPPKPVGLAITRPDKRSKYYAWGHPCENNCTRGEAVRILKEIWYSGNPIVAHNYKFDVDIANTFFNLPIKPSGGYHDTQFLAFLHNPHEDKLGLKPLAEKYLDMPPEEQDRVSEWIQSHIFLSNKFSSMDFEIRVAETKPKYWYKVPPTKTGAFLSLAPGKLVGKYACGDTDRTLKLFKFYMKQISKNGMLEAYQRELDLLPILLESERGGIKIAERRLKSDASKWVGWIESTDSWLRNKLKAPNLDVDSNIELADALENAGMVESWILTAKGNRSTAKDNIGKCIIDPQVTQALAYRSKLANAYRNFGRPWLVMAAKNSGFINTNWNQVRNDRDKGARTGRLASSPNFQNVPKESGVIVSTKKAFKNLIALDKDPLMLSKALFKVVGPLPYLRDYITPDKKGHVLLNRDFSGQELRILGHFEDGVLLNEYLKDPMLDIHEYARQMVNAMLGTNLRRNPIKTLGFGLLYGMGLGKLASSMGVDVVMAKRIKEAYLNIFPGLKVLIETLTTRGKAGEAIRTWGGRQYYVEPPKLIDGRMRTFEYKLLNVLIQGSAADCTKQAMINYDSVKREGRLLLNVHDEIMLDCPTKAAKREMQLLREAMSDVDFDVPMLSDGKSSAVSWGRMKAWKEVA